MFWNRLLPSIICICSNTVDSLFWKRTLWKRDHKTFLMLKGRFAHAYTSSCFLAVRVLILDWIPPSGRANIWNSQFLLSTVLLLNTVHPLTDVYVFKLLMLLMLLMHSVDNLWSWHANDTLESYSSTSSRELKRVRTVQAIQWLDIYQLLWGMLG